MNRRGFLKAFVTAAVGAAVAPALLRSAPGLVPVPVPAVLDPVNQATLEAIWPRAIANNFFRNTPLLSYMRAEGRLTEI